MIKYNQMIDACHMARSHNLSALIEAEAKEARTLSLYISLSWNICSAVEKETACRPDARVHIVRRRKFARRTAARSRNTLC
jgi:hypothetical protein